MRTIVSFGPLGKGVVVKLEQAPQDVAGILEWKKINLAPLNGNDARARGEQLLAILRKHQAVKAALSIALAQPPASEPQPLYIRGLAKAADELPWEQLYAAPHGFWALDSRWPVGRIASLLRDVNDRSFLPPFRVTAVLSAAGRTGVPQTESLISAVTSATAQSFSARLHVITGEQAVLDRIATENDPRVTAEVIAPTSNGVAKQLTDAKPSILHLLCHGGTAAGVRTLALATVQDFITGEQTGSVRLSGQVLVEALSTCDPWLIVLAACQTAESAEGPAMAHELADAGLPAVIGMRRLIDVTEADRFCAALYPELMATVERALRPEDDDTDTVHNRRLIDWATAMTGPRQAIADGDPVAVDTWSDPVLYAQHEPLRVYVPGGTAPLTAEEYAELRAKLDKWVEFRKTLDPATTPDAFLADADSRIAELRAQLEPAE